MEVQSETYPKVAVIGGGSFGTAVVKMVSENTGRCQWWMHNEESAAHIRQYHHNPRYLSSVAFEEGSIQIHTDINAAIAGCDIVIFAVPSAFVKEVLSHMDSGALHGKLVCSTIKGIIPDENMIVGEYLREVVGVPEDHIVVITGPCHAEEIALERLSFLTVAALDVAAAKSVAGVLQNHYVRCTLSKDIYGTEYAAVMKNIYAIAAGMCHGLGYGDNFQAVLISNAAREMRRFMKSTCEGRINIKKSAYLGDLLVTCYSQFSRNRMLGNMLGKGYTIKSAKAEMTMVAEGYYAAALVSKSERSKKLECPLSKPFTR